MLTHPTLPRLEGRKLPPEKLIAGKKLQFAVNAKADWTREITTNHCLNGVSLNKWVVVYVQKNAEVVKNFVQLMMKLAPKMGIKVAQAVMVELSNDRTETYVKGIRDSVEPQVQLVCVIMPTPRDDRCGMDWTEFTVCTVLSAVQVCCC